MSTISALGIDQAELSLFQELKEVMAKHTKVKRKFGIALEHEHFPLNDGEVLHETHDAEARILKVEVIKKESLPEHTVIAEWSLASGEPTPSRYCCTLSTPSK